jgi:sulfite reductase alpha subunit-like flavoprotein
MMTAMTFSVASGGENSFQVLAINNQLIRSVTISSTSQIFQDISQIRVGGVTTSNNPIPEPATMLLLGTGLAGIAGVVRRRRATKAE